MLFVNRMEEFSKKSGFKGTISIGWSVFWRLWLPLFAVQIALSASMERWVGVWAIIVVAVGFPLADWTGKSVALRRYYAAIPSFIGWSIWWRGIVCNWILVAGIWLANKVVSLGSLNWFHFLLIFLCILPGFFILYLLALGFMTNDFITDKISQQQVTEKAEDIRAERKSEKAVLTLVHRLIGWVNKAIRKKK